MCILYKVIVRKIKDQDAEDPYKQRGLMTKICSQSNPTTCQNPKCTGLRSQVGSKRTCKYKLSEMNALKTQREGATVDAVRAG